MRCRHAQDLYGMNRDGLLNEADRLKLEGHLSKCSECASFAADLDRGLALLKALPELSPSENFEWNVKRRIAQEKARVMRREADAAGARHRWVFRFGAAAAAVCAIAVTGLWLAFWHGPSSPVVREIASNEPIGQMVAPAQQSAGGSVHVRFQDWGAVDGMGSVYPTGMQMVASGGVQGPASIGRQSSRALEFAPMGTEDSLRAENEALRRRMKIMEREIMMLRAYLDMERMRR